MALYNGIEFPNLPEYDKEIYPYAYIVQQTLLGSSYILFLSKTPFYAKAWSSTKYIIDSNGVDTDALYHKIENGAWVNTSTWGVINHMYTPIWSNTDMFVLVEDKTAGTKTVTDTVYLKASSSIHMLLDLQSWLKGYVLGVSGMAFAKEPEPVAYLYNGLKLPPLPEWDKEVYPYAFIMEYELNDMGAHFRTANLYLVPKVEYVEANNGNWCVSLGNGYKYSNILVGLDDAGASENDYVGKEWSTLENKEGMGIVVSEIDWANFNLLNKDGSVHLATSEPVPVYE